MQQCNHCQYFVPDEILTCPKCSMPLGQKATPLSIYQAPAKNPKLPRSTLLLLGGVVLLALTTAIVATRGGGSKGFVDSPDLAPVTTDGWRPFYAPEGFTATFPSVPDRSVEHPTNTQDVVSYTVTRGDFVVGVMVLPAPAYAPPHEASRRLEEWYRPALEAQGATFEGAGQITTPLGDQAYDVVVVVNGTRKWLRYLTWNGSVIVAEAQLPATESPDETESATYKRLRDSVHH